MLNRERTLGSPTRAQCTSTCANVIALPNTPERYATLMKVLDLPDDVKSSDIEKFDNLIKRRLCSG